MLALLVANLKMLVRDRQALFWALAFPLILVTVFGVFEVSGAGSADLAIIDLANSSHSRYLREKLAQMDSRIDYLDLAPQYTSLSDAQDALKEGELEYVLVIPAGMRTSTGTSNSQNPGDTDTAAMLEDRPVSLLLYYDVNNELGNQLIFEVIRHLVDEENLRLIGQPEVLAVLTEGVETRKVEYFDVLLIGLVGMGMMTNSIIFIAVKISMYRNQSILKRILATPLRVRNYFAAEILAHLLLTLVQAAVVIGVESMCSGRTFMVISIGSS